MSTQPSVDAKAIVRALEGMTQQFARLADVLKPATLQLQRLADLLEAPPVEHIVDAAADASEPLWIGPDGDPERRCGDRYETEHHGVARCHRGRDHLGAHRGFSTAGREYTWPHREQRSQSAAHAGYISVHLAWELKKCNKPDCRRMGRAGCGHCCAPCAVAAEGSHEVAQHSEGCEERHAERGDWQG
ncbi:hypothetical protein [Streptomyces sp. NPDC047009]|uniref:hypothetical protein n=1 Tax=Streptomyces sp. NPDC047009 TaxID=3154496 RepID=UPI0033F9911B